MISKRHVALFLVAVAVSLALPEESSQATLGARKKPNIVFFFVDDLGWNDVSFHGMTQIPTPNIHAMASDGIILNSYYTAPVCTPSRASLMTGYYPSTTGNQHMVISNSQAAGLPLQFKILPQFLRDLGYANHMIGKWHLGFFKKEYTPTARGFDSHYGFWSGATDHFFHTCSEPFELTRLETLHVPRYEGRFRFNMTGIDFRSGFRKVENRVGQYLTDIYTDEAVKLIQQHDGNKPLFLYLSHHGVHRGSMEQPIRAPEKYTKLLRHITDEDRRNFGGSLMAIDNSLGEVMAALERKNMMDNTILIFSPDNGAPKPGTFLSTKGSNYPLRGSKITGFEGGSRASAFVWSPLLPRRKLFDGLMHISDWMPTLYQAAGGEVDDLGPLDGMSMWRALLGKENSSRTDVLLVSDPMYNMTSYRYGDYKVVWGDYIDKGINGHFGIPGREIPPAELTATDSLSEVVLRRYYRNKSHHYTSEKSSVDVNCGEMLKEDGLECVPEEEICLFNIKNDPCEYNNLAQKHPEILQNILGKYEILKQRIAEPWYPKPDYRANPVYHGGYWGPWMDEP